MKLLLRYTFLMTLASLLIVSCNKDEEDNPPPIESTETGFLSLNLSLVIQQESARLKDVSTDDFYVKIYQSGETEPVMEFHPYSDMPAEVELETGTYWIEAENIDSPEAAAFDQPWYYGRSDEFNIDKEDLVAISIECTLANYKVAFNYSENIPLNFTTWTSKATRVGGGEFLEWAHGDNREGYFLIDDNQFPFDDTPQSLSIEVHLEYEKVFEEGVIARDFYATVDVPQPATLYRVNIDATLQDGIVTIGISVDDGFETVDINPVSSITFSGPGSVDEIEGGATIDEDENNPQQGFGRDLVKWYVSDVWLADSRTVLWGPAPDMIRASMDGGTYSPDEILDFDAGQSDLVNGHMVFTGSTLLPLSTGPTLNVELKFEIWVKDKVSQNPRALNSPSDYGLPPSIGGLVEIADISDEVEVDFVIWSRQAGTVTWSNFLDYYDVMPTLPGPLPSEGGGDAYTSFTGGFYWSNQ